MYLKAGLFASPGLWSFVRYVLKTGDSRPRKRYEPIDDKPGHGPEQPRKIPFETKTRQLRMYYNDPG